MEFLNRSRTDSAQHDQNYSAGRPFAAHPGQTMSALANPPVRYTNNYFPPGDLYPSKLSSLLHMGAGAEGGGGQMTKTRKRKQVKVACIPCRIAKVGCCATRPCLRCVNLQIDCVDGARKRKKKGELQPRATLIRGRDAPATEAEIEHLRNEIKPFDWDLDTLLEGGLSVEHVQVLVDREHRLFPKEDTEDNAEAAAERLESTRRLDVKMFEQEVITGGDTKKADSQRTEEIG